GKHRAVAGQLPTQLVVDAGEVHVDAEPLHVDAAAGVVGGDRGVEGVVVVVDVRHGEPAGRLIDEGLGGAVAEVHGDGVGAVVDDVEGVREDAADVGEAVALALDEDDRGDVGDGDGRL